MRQYELLCLADIEAEEVGWLMYPFIPLGKVTILAGNPGEGKTTAILNLIASWSKGEKLIFAQNPERNFADGPINIIYQSAEDGIGDTIKPRLMAADANCDHIMCIDESYGRLNFDDERLSSALYDTGAKLLVLDPLQAYIGSRTDTYKANEVREQMIKLIQLAEKHHCAVVVITHLNKDTSKEPLMRVLGGIDFVGASRSVLICGRLIKDPLVRVITQVKSSLAPEGAPIAFRLDPIDGFRWLGAIDVDPSEIDMDGSTRSTSKLVNAQGFLREIFSESDIIEASKILSVAAERGIAKRTLNEAKSLLKIKSERKNNQWYWRMP